MNRSRPMFFKVS